MTTALLVVNWGAISDASGFVAALPWFLPTLIGSPVIAWVSAQVAMGKRPRTWVRDSRPPISAGRPAPS